MLKGKRSFINYCLTVADILIALVSINIAYYIEFGALSLILDGDYLALHLLIIIFWYLISKGLGVDVMFRSLPYSIVLFNCIGQVAIGTSLIAISILAFNLFYIGLKLLLLFALIDLVLTFTLKIVLFMYIKNVRRKGRNFLNVLVIGDQTSKSFLRQVLYHPEWGYRIVAVVSDFSFGKEIDDKMLLLHENSDIEKLLRDKMINEVILIKEKPSQYELENLIHICSEVGVVFRLYSPFFNMLANKTYLRYYGTLPLLTISGKPINYIELKVKRVIDISFSVLVLSFLSPLFLIIGIAIKFDSKGPVFFKQKREGLRGRIFDVYKFRSMIVNAEELKRELEGRNEMDGPVFKMSNDPRITKLGRFLRKTSLDELPQFYNVLMGEMSVVGPRPPLPDEVKKYQRWQLRRLSMKPGITCIWQVSGRNSVPFEEWMKMDLQYIDNWSLKLDFVIFLKTIRAIIRSEGQ